MFLGKTCDDETSYIYSIVPTKVQHDNRIFLQILDILCPSRLPYQPHPDFTTHFPPSVKPTGNSVWLILCCRRKGPPQRPPCPSSSSIHSSQRRGATCNSCSLVNSAGRGRGIGTAGDARCIAKKSGGNRCETEPRLAKDQAHAMVIVKHVWKWPIITDEGVRLRGEVRDHIIHMTLWYGWMSSACMYCIQYWSHLLHKIILPHLQDDHT